MTFIPRPVPRRSLPKTFTGGADAAEHLDPAVASACCPNPMSDGSHGVYLLAASPMVISRTRKRTGQAGADGSAVPVDKAGFADATDATAGTLTSRSADTATAASRSADTSDAARSLRARYVPARSVPDWTDSQAGMATAEYAIATLAAVAFAGLLAVVLGSDEVRGMLVSLIRSALTLG